MCGIAGIVGGRIDEGLLGRMTDALHRRGPDDRGQYLDPAGGCGLGHRRLSIIDLAGGHQPLATADGRVQVVVNGEIYNFEALRAELEAKGHRFATRSDCEVVVHGWREWGEEVIERLEGMFALALWDAEQRVLLLARDRMGQKPLYFARLGDSRLVFGSEAKALFVHPEVSRRPSPRGLALYLTYECVPEGFALTEGLQKLLPGQYLCFAPEAGTMRVESYWRMRFASSPDVSRVQGASENDLINLLRERVLAAVKARLISDVPLGVLLSGGVDSSLVAAAMTQVGSERVQSFSIAFDDESFDESSHARRVAEHLGTDHHEDRLSPATMLDILPAVAEVMCEPIGDASIIPTYLLSRFTRQTVTVALGGDGGDELFLGYPTFAADRVARAMDAAVPLGVQGWLGRGALQAAGYLPVSRKNFSFDFKVKRFAQGLGFGAAERHQAWMGSFMPQELQDVLQPEVADEALGKSPYALIEDLHAGSDARDGLDEASLQYARLYLTGGVLVKVDRASMAHALEVRAPLLDREVVELATAVPSSLKLKGFTTKYLLKEAARPWLPEGIVDRPKKGFGVPIADWLRGPLKPLTRELLAPDRLRRAGWFRPEAVTALLNAHEAGTADHRKPLWTLLAFELWRDRHGVEAGA